MSHTHYKFIVKEATYERLCETKNILTVNGKFPGPTLKVHKGETIFVTVYNRGNDNITLHWHGVHQPRNPWSDGPEYITQCPIKPGDKFRYKVIFSEEEGTLWWHAHSDWSRATVHGAIFIYPRPGAPYPFPLPDYEFPILLGEWWKEDIRKVLQEFVASGGLPRDSDAYTINGQPGDLYPCSENGTYTLKVKQGKKYLLRLINADMNEVLFFGVANHNLTVVGTDGSYTKPLKRKYITISPGQTFDCLLEANQDPGRYYMAASAYINTTIITFDNSTTTAIVEYKGSYDKSIPPVMPYLPNFNDTTAAFDFCGTLRSLASEEHPIDVPLDVDHKMVSTLSVNTLPCDTNQTCSGPNGTRLLASMTNNSFVLPPIDILKAYYYQLEGVYGENFPDFPPLEFNYTADFQPFYLQTPNRATEVKMIKYNEKVEIILQGTSLVAPLDHPMHLHGFSFYVVGYGFGNYDEIRDPPRYNLVDPPLQNTVLVPRNSWAAIRFKANNPGVWFMHCHFERHVTWGMETVFIVRNGERPGERMFPPPNYMPPCC
ncbi:hypothetical protein Leryth_010354 [Lithospermum erythrorhizon]|nr:hypothetical protein Leryth_010354 [Lithospermum erythrorhizon]